MSVNFLINGEIQGESSQDRYKKNKNMKIYKMIKLLEHEYVNSHNLNSIDTNPKHFIDEYQFAKYASNYLNKKDPHFYAPIITAYKYYISGIFNKHGYLCIDSAKINGEVLDNLIGKNRSSLKIVIDLRAANQYRISTKTWLVFLSKFDIVRNKFVNNQKIYQLINKHGEVTEQVLFSNNHLEAYNSKGKLFEKINLEKIPMYKCDELVCISQDDNLYTMLLNALGVPIFVNSQNNIENVLYYSEKIGRKYIYIPMVYMDTFSEYQSTLGIPEKFYIGL